MGYAPVLALQNLFEQTGTTPGDIDVIECIRPDTTLETLAKLRPAFEEGGSVTAGNASGINDGAAALVLATQSAAQEKGETGLVTLEAVATAAMDPGLMGYAPVLALQNLFETGPAPPPATST
ncbi:Acetyl-CoA acetyltransferase [Rhodococcus opacus PD630]|nr:Acetyl-CoA acetyltransferase [Rhodococcus opacus PD630]